MFRTYLMISSLVQTNIKDMVHGGLLLMILLIMLKKATSSKKHPHLRIVQKSWYPIWDHSGWIDIPFLTKTPAKHHILWCRTYLYRSYNGVLPSTGLNYTVDVLVSVPEDLEGVVVTLCNILQSDRPVKSQYKVVRYQICRSTDIRPM